MLGRRGREPTRPFSVTSAAPLHRHQPVHTTSAVPVQRTFEGHTQTQSKTDAQFRQHSAHGTNSHSGNGAKFSGKPLVFTNSNGRNVRSQNVRGVGIPPAPPLRSRPPNSGRVAAFEQNNPTTRVGTTKAGPSKVMFQKHRAAPQIMIKGTVVFPGDHISIPISFFPTCLHRPRLDRTIIHRLTPTPNTARRFSTVPSVHKSTNCKKSGWRLPKISNVWSFWVNQMFPRLQNRRNETSNWRATPELR